AEAMVPTAGTATLALAGFGAGPEAGGPADSGPADSGPTRPGNSPPEPAQPGDAPPEPAQPVFSRYWLHGKGPAPAGNLPVAVHLSPGRITLPGPRPGAPAAPAALCLSVASAPGGGAGEVTLDLPPGLAVPGPAGTPPGPLRYSF